MEAVEVARERLVPTRREHFRVKIHVGDVFRFRDLEQLIDGADVADVFIHPNWVNPRVRLRHLDDRVARWLIVRAWIVDDVN